MCGGMKYNTTDPESGQAVERTVYFPRPKCQIPAISDGGEVEFFTWGTRDKNEFPGVDVPQTGWARFTSLEKDYWQRHNPVKVLIPAIEFCEKPTGFKKSVWFPPLKPDTYLLGLKLVKEGMGFVYVVTVEPPEVYFGDIDRLPAIVKPDFSMADIIEPYHDDLTKFAKGQLKLF